MSEPLPTASRLDPSLALQAARRLVVGTASEREAAAKRLVESAPAFGIRLDLAWGITHETEPELVRQVALVVPGSGRTGMLFVSGPSDDPNIGTPRTQRAELASCVRAACEGIRGAVGDEILLVQGLPDPSEHHAVEAYHKAGMMHVGDLAYLRRPARLKGEETHADNTEWPDGITVQSLASLGDDAGDEALGAALESTYLETLDCPKLCGLRDTRDVIASHRSTGVYDPSTWWVVSRDGKPEGCCLLSHCPEHAAMELVYIGIGPGLRGMGMGRRLLAFGLARASRRDVREITCAVDRSNRPALRLYRDFGFVEFASRVAFVRRAGS